MKRLAIASFIALLTAVQAYSQGQFLFYNGSAPTRVGTIDGPFADSNYWAQMLVGPTADALTPVSVALPHFNGGLVGGVAPIIVTNIPCFETAYIQMVAWDGRLWGTSLEGVPADQLGRTDIVPQMLTCFPLPTYAPIFTQPAIVPIPEPSVWALGILAGSLAFVSRFARRHLRHPK